MVIIWIERGWGYDNSGNAGEEKRTGIYLRADRGAVRTPLGTVQKVLEGLR